MASLRQVFCNVLRWRHAFTDTIEYQNRSKSCSLCRLGCMVALIPTGGSGSFDQEVAGEATCMPGEYRGIFLVAGSACPKRASVCYVAFLRAEEE